MRTTLTAVAAAVVASVIVVGCGGSPTSPSAVSGRSSASTPAASHTAAPTAPELGTPELSLPPASPGATLPIPSGAAVALDPALLALLPSSVGGAPVSQEPGSFAEAIKDPSFVASIDRAVFAIAVSGGDLASGVVAHVRQGVYSDKMFEDWRSSYDQGACAQSNGVVAHAEQTLGGRTTYVTTCGGGLRVYHAYLASQGVIVSLFSTGAQDFGGQLVGGIQG